MSAALDSAAPAPASASASASASSSAAAASWQSHPPTKTTKRSPTTQALAPARAQGPRPESAGWCQAQVSGALTVGSQARKLTSSKQRSPSLPPKTTRRAPTAAAQWKARGMGARPSVVAMWCHLCEASGHT